MADPIAEDVPYRAVKDTAARDADDELDIVEQRLDQAEKSSTPTPCLSDSTEPPRYQSQLPNRYRKRDTQDNNPDAEAAREERRTKARETRRTRRTVRLQQQEQELKRQLIRDESEIHLKVEGSSESEASSVDENYDVASIAEDIEESLTWRGRMQLVLHNHWLHLVIVILVALDAFIVIFELLLDIGAFDNRLCSGKGLIEQGMNCHFKSSDRCPPHARMILAELNITQAVEHGSIEYVCHCGFDKGLFVCLEHDRTSGVNPAFVLHIFSLIILTIFLVEIIVKMLAFRLKYFTHKFEVFDGIIVCISWTLDVASVVQEEAFEAAALLIVLRLWRVIRIVNGAVLTSKSQSDRHLETAKHEARKVVHALHKAQDKMDEFEDENIKLKSEMKGLHTKIKYAKLQTTSVDSDDDTKL